MRLALAVALGVAQQPSLTPGPSPFQCWKGEG